MFGGYLVKKSYLCIIKHLRQSLDIFVSLRYSSAVFGNLLLDILNQIILAFWTMFVSLWKKFTVTVNCLMLVLK